jgi:hypothetical protein
VSIRKRCPWYLYPWVLAGGFFVFVPLGIVGVFCSPLVRFWSKLRFLLFLLLVLALLPKFIDYIDIFEYHRAKKRFSEEKNAFRYENALTVLQDIKPSEELGKLELLLEKSSLYNSLGRGVKADESFKQAQELFLQIFATEFSEPSINRDFAELVNDFLNRKLFFPPAENPQKQKIKELSGLHLPSLLQYALFSGTKEEAEELILRAYQFCVFSASGYGRSTVEFYLLFYLVRFLPERIPDFEKGWGKKLMAEIQTYARNSPYNLTARYLRAMVCELGADYAGALEDYLYIFMLDTRFFKVFERIKNLNYRLNKAETDFLDKYLEAEDRRFFNADFTASLHLFEALLQELSIDSDYRMFEEEILFNMGIIYRNNIRDYEKAVAVFRRIVELRSFRMEEGLYNLVMSCLSMGNTGDCEIYLKELLYRFPQTRHWKRLLTIRFYLQARKAFMEFINRMKK